MICEWKKKHPKTQNRVSNVQSGVSFLSVADCQWKRIKFPKKNTQKAGSIVIEKLMAGSGMKAIIDIWRLLEKVNVIDHECQATVRVHGIKSQWFGSQKSVNLDIVE